MSTELRISSLPLSLNVLVYAHASVGVFTSTPFFPPGGFNFSSDGGALLDAWLYFPGIKVGKIHFYLSFLTGD